MTKIDKAPEITSVIAEKKTLNELFGVCGDVKVSTFIKTSRTPQYEFHSFPEDLVQLGVAWMHLKVKQNLLLLGHTGTGKTSFGEQFCNRIGQSVYRVGCHGRLEFGELLGGWRLVLADETQFDVSKMIEDVSNEVDWRQKDPDVDSGLKIKEKEVMGGGSFFAKFLLKNASVRAILSKVLSTVLHGKVVQKWFDGPLIRAMEEGAVLLLDEGNFLDPSVIGGLNGPLDGTPVYIPETNRLIYPHANFRVMMTGNPIGPNYKGVKKFNIALLDRFLVGSVDYLDPVEEAGVVNNCIPKLESWVIELLIKTVTEVRNQFKNDEMETTISTRGLITWARMLKVFGSALAKAVEANDVDNSVKIICKALDMAVTFRSPEVERQSIHLFIKNTFNIPSV